MHFTNDNDTRWIDVEPGFAFPFGENNSDSGDYQESSFFEVNDIDCSSEDIHFIDNSYSYDDPRFEDDDNEEYINYLDSYPN